MRYLCEVLDEMRNCYKTYNFSPILSLIEEAQMMGNRMESALGERRDYFSWHDETKEARKRLEELEKEIKKLQKQKEQLEGDSE